MAEAAIAQRAEGEPQGISQSTRFSVEIVFLMMDSRLGPADLDNLAKPVLDTLFRSRHPQKDRSLTGALVDVDDDRVFKLLLEKRSVVAEGDEGIDVCVTWE